MVIKNHLLVVKVNLLRDKPGGFSRKFFISLRTALPKQGLTLPRELQHCVATALARSMGIYYSS